MAFSLLSKYVPKNYKRISFQDKKNNKIKLEKKERKGSMYWLGAEVSLYTGKVRAYLRIPFTEVVASAEVRSFLILYIYLNVLYIIFIF